MSKKECVEVSSAFISRYVRAEFAQKFKDNFDGYKPITARYFHNHVVLESLDARVDDTFGATITTEISAKVLFVSVKDPVCFLLYGYPITLRDIFAVEGDAIAEINFGVKKGYLFLSGAREDIFKFPKKN